MHSVRTADDERGNNNIMPNAEALELSEEISHSVPDSGIRKVDFFATEPVKMNWDVVVTNPALLCKEKLF